jgi:MFS superfamily sulfate permease-like transporter
MTLGRREAFADRMALLATRAELDRARVTLALHEVKAIVAPPRDPARAAAVRPAIAMLMGLAVPAVGISRLGRWLRIASIALAAWRVARNWRSAR